MSSHQNKSGKRKDHRGNRNSRRNLPDQNEALLLTEKTATPQSRGIIPVEPSKSSQRRN